MPASTKGPRIHNLTSGRRTRRSGDRRTGFLQQLVRSGIFKLSEIYWLTDEHFGHLSGRIQYGLEPQSFVDLHSKPVICYEQDERSNPRLKSPKRNELSHSRCAIELLSMLRGRVTLFQCTGLFSERCQFGFLACK
jgi:hypothetical protein